MSVQLELEVRRGLTQKSKKRTVGEQVFEAVCGQ